MLYDVEVLRLSQQFYSDYPRIAIITNTDYLESTPAVVDNDEYNETMINLERIILEATEYINTYVNHVNGTRVLHHRDYTRKYAYSTLPYFHDILNI